jgi:hypothetical protein
MSLTEELNESYGDNAKKVNEAVLAIEYGSPRITLTYDFNARVMVTRGWYQAPPTVTPFSSLDPESLVAMRERLEKLGGHPPKVTGARSGPSPQQQRGLHP